MGCGQSSLKGEKQEDIQTEAPKPLKKVATNFNTPDYETPNNQERRNTEYAPHDEVQVHKPSEALSPLTEKKSNPISVDAASQPAASTQPDATTTSNPAGFENKLPNSTPQDPSTHNPVTKEPYKDITANSPTTPTTASNVANAFPESQHATAPKPTQ